MKYVSLYIAIINIASFAAMGLDKAKARREAWRTPERVLFLLAAAGGSLGAIAGMFFFRHKTRHLSFRIGLPAILALQLAVCWYLYNRGIFHLLFNML